MSGAETLKRIREFNKDLPVIIISAHLDDERAKEANSYGVSGVFYKESDFSEGLTLLETVLRTHKKLKK
jgi:DNA-binding NarL/FixJ family response regulator